MDSLIWQEGLAPLSAELSGNLYQYISHIPTPHAHHKHKQGVSLHQFQVFAAHLLKGTFEEKAAIFCGMKNSRELSMAEVCEVLYITYVKFSKLQKQYTCLLKAIDL